jgi:F0F1-type ATP synthase assembly protein I
MNELVPPKGFSPEELRWYYALYADLAILKKGAAHLRRLGWWGVILLGSGFLLIMAGAAFFGPIPLVIAFIFGCVLIGVVTGPYFFLARNIDRGRRWAVVGAMLLIGFIASVTCFAIVKSAMPTAPQQQAAKPVKQDGPLHSWVWVLMETAYLIGHLNLLKLLVQCHRAAGRVQRASLPPVDVLAADGFSDPAG